MFGSDADVRVAYADSVMMHVGEGHDEGKNSQDENYDSNQQQGFHNCFQTKIFADQDLCGPICSAPDLWQESG
jgi:hypothetical protein